MSPFFLLSAIIWVRQGLPALKHVIDSPVKPSGPCVSSSCYFYESCVMMALIISLIVMDLFRFSGRP